MWIFLGVLAIVATGFNLYLFIKGKDYQWAQVLGLAFMSLTLATLHSGISVAVEAEDWVSLMDVLPTMSTALWIVTIISIGLNLLPLVLKKRK